MLARRPVVPLSVPLRIAVCQVGVEQVQSPGQALERINASISPLFPMLLPLSLLLGRRDDSAALGKRLRLPLGVAENLPAAAAQERFALAIASDPLLAPIEVLGHTRLHGGERLDLLLPGRLREARGEQPRIPVAGRLLDDRTAALVLLVERRDPSSRVVHRGVDVRRLLPLLRVEGSQLLIEEDPLVFGQGRDPAPAALGCFVLLLLCDVE